jgi:hypothetical protein
MFQHSLNYYPYSSFNKINVTFWRIAIAESGASFLRPLSRPFTIISLKAFKDSMVLNKSLIPCSFEAVDYTAPSIFWRSAKKKKKNSLISRCHYKNSF